MIGFKLFLEKRSHADQNPKISVVEALEPFKNNPDIYIHYSKIPKIGINPKAPSSNDTPNGIYCYPVRECWDMIENNKLEYAGDFPYVWVLKSKNRNFIKDLHKDYKESDLKRDKRTLMMRYGDVVERRFASWYPRTTMDKIIWRKAGGPHPARILFRTTELFAKLISNSDTKYQHLWNALLRKDLDYSGFADKSGEGHIHEGEKIQAVFLDTKAYTIVDMLENKTYETIVPKSFDELQEFIDEGELNLRDVLIGLLHPDKTGRVRIDNDYYAASEDEIKIYSIPVRMFQRNPKDVAKFLVANWDEDNVLLPLFGDNMIINKINVGDDFYMDMVKERFSTQTLRDWKKIYDKNTTREVAEKILDAVFKSHWKKVDGLVDRVVKLLEEV